MQIPENPKVYHITHVENLPLILQDGCLWSDAKRLELNVTNTLVGMKEIKRRRIEELSVLCHPNTTVGEYVPFYFCPRSVMLFILHCGNHPDIDYNEGQTKIIHLECDLNSTCSWAIENNKMWAFSNCNAGTRYAHFFNDLQHLQELNWNAIQSRDFRDVAIKDGKQAEFLFYECFPIQLVQKIGVCNQQIQQRVVENLEASSYTVDVAIERTWYY